jgi:response regulator RpfG family c-di-GMP phosphodiesterase
MSIKPSDYETDIVNANILIVDDKTANVLLLELMLSRAGYTSVSSTQDPQAVFDLYKRNRYDLILLDLQMPEMDGFQVMDALQELEPDGYVPILVITAQPDQKVRALQLGAKDFISKPFDQVEVLLRIHSMLEIRLLHRELKRYSLNLEEKVVQRTETLNLAIQDLDQANKSLKKQYIDSIRAFSRTIEMRPGIKRGQSKYIAEQAQLVAQELGLTAKEKQDILYAGLLLQIGKVSLPDTLLAEPVHLMSKVNKLLYLKHAVEGESLLKRLIQLRGASLLIRHQYERYDGLGYPDGLLNQKIPLGSRILNVIRDYIAYLDGSMTGVALPVWAAIDLLLMGKESNYDPEILSAFVQVLKYSDREEVVGELPK